MMADRRHPRDAHNDSPVGPVLPPRIRKALVALRSARGRIVEDGRDLYKGSRTMVYLYRAVDKAGQTVDFLLSRNRDVNAAKSFLRSAMKKTRVPTKITLDAYAASHRAVREMKEGGELPRRVKVRSSQYLNNLVEQDHRRVKKRIRPMLGFKRFDNAAVTISGIELAEKIKKGPYKTGKLGGRRATMSELWNAALAA
jgi:transposase-like protein